MNWDGVLKLVFIFLLAFVPSLVWLAFYLRKDPRPEPRRFLLLTFFLGAFITIIGSQAENVWFKSWAHNSANPQLGMLVLLFFFPFLEELFKFIAARLSTIKNKYFLDEACDPMIYMITAALGFAAAENLKVYFATIFGQVTSLTLHNILNINLSQDILLGLAFTAIIRFIATVLLHSLSSGILGYFWSLARLSQNKFKVWLLAIPTGLLFATILHSLFNYLIMNINTGTFYLPSLVIFLIISGVIVSRALRQLENC